MKNHLVFKFLAVVLSALALLSTILGSVGVIAFADIGLYSDSLTNVQSKQMASDMLALAERIAMHYDTSQQPQKTQAFLDSFFADYDEENEIRRPSEGMWYYELIDSNTNEIKAFGPGTQVTTSAVLYDEYLVQSKYPVILDILDETESLPTEPEAEPTQPPEEVPEDPLRPERLYPEGWYPYEFSQTGAEKQTFVLVDADGPIYKVRIYLLPGAYEQQVAFLWELMELAYEHRYFPVLLLVAGLLVLAVSLTFLCTTAGKKPGSKALKPAALNCIPLDLYFASAAGLVFYLVDLYIRMVKSHFGRDTAVILVLSIAITAYLACVLIIGAVFAAAAQLQQPDGYWWRRSAVYNLFRLLKRGGKALWQLLTVFARAIRGRWAGFVDILPLTWQWLLWALALLAAVVLAVLLRNWWVIGIVAAVVAASVYYMLHSYKQLLDAAKRMSRGDLDTPVDTEQLMGGFKEFAAHLNALADVAVVAAQKHMRSERMRAELITNVSHDIKTPLTSIINYVDLLRSAEDRESAEQYLEVLSRQSARMKKLIDDLIELSKASTGNMPVDIQTADAVEYLNQAIGEFSDKLEKVPLEPIFRRPEQPVYMRCDSRLTWRVLSNLFSNAVKYALPGTRLYVDVVAVDGQVLISLKNISRQQLNVSSQELMERFVRGDASRNTEGSGLGLNIAQSLMELQKGQLQLLVDGDLFKATLVFPRAMPSENE